MTHLPLPNHFIALFCRTIDGRQAKCDDISLFPRSVASDSAAESTFADRTLMCGRNVYETTKPVGSSLHERAYRIVLYSAG